MPTIIESIKFYTIQETAIALKVTPQTIRAWIKKGKIKSQRIGRPILITENNIREFLQPSTGLGRLKDIRQSIANRKAQLP
jgi:excisionase family DNA binding protein